MQIGYTVQILFLKNLGRRIPLNVEEIPFKQIISDLKFSRFQLTEKIINIADYQTINLVANKDIVFYFLQKLKELKVVAPGLSTIEDVLEASLKKSEDKIYIKVLEQLQNLENLQVILEADEKGESLYTQLKNTSEHRK